MEKDNVVLIGMPGAGKSTLGVVLAKIVGYDFLDADILIQHRYGKTLQQIIDEVGPEGFLQVENEVLCDIETHCCVISPGGSAVYSAPAMEHFRDGAKIVYLKVSLEDLSERLGGLEERGVVMRNGMGGLADIYAERTPLYERYADLTLDLEGLSVRDAAVRLAKSLGFTAQ